MSVRTVLKRSCYQYGSPALRKSLLLCSYFRKPEFGVTQWEELSRTSAFFVRSKLARKKYHVISAAHTSHPFLFPKFYPEEYPRFLKFLSESDCRNSLQLRDLESGTVLKEWDLSEKSWLEEGKDLVVTHLKEEDRFLQELERDFSIQVTPIELSTAPVPPESLVTFYGHDFTKDSDGNEVFMPTSLAGRVRYAGSSKIVVKTLEPSVMGMCGGPVLLGDHVEGNPPCVGMVEARVSINQKPAKSEAEADAREESALKDLNDHTVVMSSKDILKLLVHVEAQMAISP